MINNLIKKGLALAIILLFICSGVVSAFNTDNKTDPLNNGNWLYVGGSGEGNYSSIQDAIDNATDGDTVFVYDDSSPYFENIVVNKSINLSGENKETTIISGNGTEVISPVVLISSSFVKISGFEIINGSDGINIESNKNSIIENNTIIDNFITNNNYGLSMSGSNNNNIVDNIIIMNKWDGINMYYCTSNTIIGNDITSNEDCGVILNTFSNYNIIQNNTIQNNYFGIVLAEVCLYNVIKGNNISKNRNESMILAISHRNIIESNIIENIIIQGYKNLIRKNNFIGNIKHMRSAGGRNIWDANYWDDWIGLKFKWPMVQKIPKILLCWILPLGVKYNIPYFSFDWHPAKEPYHIPT